MSRLLLLSIACVGCAIAAQSGDNKPDFTGNWTLNLDRSNFGKAPKPTRMTLTVSREGDLMRAIETTDSQVGPSDSQSDWVLDGKEHATSSATPGKVLTRWEGNTLYTERRADDGSFTQRIWLSLSPDGKTASEKVWTRGSEGTNISHLIWERR
jgi:hypothetical protein